MRTILFPILFSFFAVVISSGQMPPPDVVGPGVSQELAKWRAARYSDVRYKLNLTLEKMSPVLKGTIEIRVKISPIPTNKLAGDNIVILPGGLRPIPEPALSPIILDWRPIRGSEKLSTISNVSINGNAASLTLPAASAIGNGETAPGGVAVAYEESNEHLIFRDGVVAGENVIKLDFTSPILASGSAITRYVDK